MQRAKYGDEDLYIFAGARPDSWAIWLSQLAKRTTIGQQPSDVKD
jgi:hypothetical protein